MIARMKRLIDGARSSLTGTPAYVRRYQDLLASLEIPKPPEFDLVFVLPSVKRQGWILDAICREIDAHCGGRTAMVSNKDSMPSSRAYFYSHYGFMRETVLKFPEVLHGRNLAFYTHPRQFWYSDDELYFLMNMSDRVVSMCSRFARELVANGVREDRVEVGLVGADPEFFQPHERGAGRIGFCSGYVPRKGGDRVLELVRSMPHRSFTLCGKKWDTWERFEELRSLPNLKYLDIPYSRYPEFYASIDVFVSVSELEGGPVPLIEAAMSNVVPVCSNTGHAPDIIIDGLNGFLFDPFAPTEQIQTLIERASKLTCDVRTTVRHLTWERLSRQVQRLAGILPEADALSSTKSEAA